MKKVAQITERKHLERLWEELPEKSPLRELGKETLEDIFLPADQRTLIQIDPTRKEPYSIALTDLFTEKPDASLLSLLFHHSRWLARKDPDGLEAYNSQFNKCSIHFQNTQGERLRVADAVEFHENTQDKMATRSAIREILEETDPDLLTDMLSTEKRDLFARVEKIYSIHKGAAHRPKKK